MKRGPFHWCSLVILAILFLLLPKQGYAIDVTLVWDANNETDLAGYRIFYKTAPSGLPYNGTDADQGPSPVTVPLADLNDPHAPEYTLSGLNANKIYFFAVTAYDSENFDSQLSEEVALAFTQEDTPIAIGVIGNERINPVKPLITVQPSNGTVHAYHSSETLVTLKINPVNVPPVAKNNFYPLDNNGSITTDAESGVLFDDTDEDADPLTATVVSEPLHGLLNLNPDGSFTYTHDGSETTNDTFIYMADDGNGGTHTAVVRLFKKERVTDGQLVLYTFEEGEGTVINDISGVGIPLNLTVENEAAINWLPSGGLLISADTLIRSTNTATKVINGVKNGHEITIEAWVMFNNLTPLDNPPSYPRILWKNNAYFLGQANTPGNKVYFQINNGSQWCGTSATDLQRTWHYVVGVYDGTALKIYIDGMLRNSKPQPGSIGTSPDNLTIGSEDGTKNYFNGTIDEVRIWSRALST